MWLFMVVTCLIQLSANSEKLIKRHLNPQGFMNISEIIDYWGYPSEQYEILTADGYFLQANRIPYGVHSPGKTGPRPAVLLVHGILSEGRCWILNLPNNSIAFFLADAGYDVWIINCRGTTWSRRHLYLTIDQEQFWDFRVVRNVDPEQEAWKKPEIHFMPSECLGRLSESCGGLITVIFHEMGIYDIPATINFILQKTKQDALYYVGHSQGASLSLVAFSVLPQLAQKVKLSISFAPVYSLVDIKGLCEMLLSIPENMAKAMWGKKELCFVSDQTKTNVAKMCSYKGIDQLCAQLAFISLGFNEKNVNMSRTDVYVSVAPDVTSVKTGIHWQQVYRSKQFKYFDYGSRNKAVYNKTTPPFYKIEDMIVPTAVWYGGHDFIASKENVEQLLSVIPHLVFQKYIPSWQHADYLMGLDAPELLYHDMLFLMQHYK